MIITTLKGGLGNQLFQYAAGCYLAERHQTQLRVDVTFFHNTYGPNTTARCYELPLVGLNPRTIRLPKLAARVMHRLGCITEEQDKPLLGLDTVSNHSYLDGYWQLAEVVNDVPGFRRAIRLPPSPITLATATTPVAISVRRGDYLRPPHSHVFETVPISYYQQAVSLILKQVSNPHFYLFGATDDIAWATEAFAWLENKTILDDTTVGHNFLGHLSIYQQCTAHIMGNSSFHWWGAWLANARLVIAPRKWLKGDKPTPHALLPKDWVLL